MPNQRQKQSKRAKLKSCRISGKSSPSVQNSCRISGKSSPCLQVMPANPQWQKPSNACNIMPNQWQKQSKRAISCRISGKSSPSVQNSCRISGKSRPSVRACVLMPNQSLVAKAAVQTCGKPYARSVAS